jgi:hypothetical protein
MNQSSFDLNARVLNFQHVLEEFLKGNIEELCKPINYQCFTFDQFTQIVSATTYANYLRYIKSTSCRYTIYVIVIAIAIVENEIDMFKQIKSSTWIIRDTYMVLDYQIPLHMLDIVKLQIGDDFFEYLLKVNNVDGIMYYIDQNIETTKIYVYACFYANIKILELLKPFSQEMMDIAVICRDLSCIKFLIDSGVKPDVLIVNAFISNSENRTDYSIIADKMDNSRGFGWGLTSDIDNCGQENNIMHWYINSNNFQQIDRKCIENALHRISNYKFCVNPYNIELFLDNIDIDDWMDTNAKAIGIIYSLSCQNNWIDLLKRVGKYCYIDSPYLLEEILISGKGTNVEIVKILLDTNIDPNYVTPNGSIIDFAIRRCNIDIVQLLLDYNANVNAKSLLIALNRDIIVCSISESIKIAKLLINSGIDMKNHSHEILIAAIVSGQGGYGIECLKMLLDIGIEIDIDSNAYAKACIQSNNIPALDLLAQYNINMDVIIDDQLINTWWINLHMIKKLVKYNIDVPIHNKKFRQIVGDNKDNGIIQWLESEGYCLN